MHKRETTAIVVTMLVVIAIIVVFAWRVTTQEPDVLDVPETPSSALPVPKFGEISDVKEKKAAFFSYLKPEVDQQNLYLLTLRHYLLELQRKIQNNTPLDDHDREQFDWLISEYRVDKELIPKEQVAQLLVKVDIIPAELVLVQAANESAWGTSRFAEEGYNFYGLWCYQKGCGFVPARRNSGAKHEVAKFNNASRSTYTYMRNLNRHDAYRELREIRRSLRENQKPISGYALAEGLIHYSERGAAYVEELQTMMRYNKEYLN